MFKRLSFVLIFLLFFIVGCSFNPFIQKPVEQSGNYKINTHNINNQDLLKKSAGKIKKFTDYDELKNFLEENNLVESRISYGYGIFNNIGIPQLLQKGFIAEGLKVDTWGSSDASFGSKETTSYSKTNVQVEGVDEADIIKTDGEYIYALSGNNLFIVKAYPPKEAEVLSKISFKLQPEDIYINDNYLVVFGRDINIYNNKKLIRRNGFTFLKVFDISDRKNPKQVRDLDFEGKYLNSRMIGDYVYFITANYNYYYIEDEPVIPRILENGKVLPNKCEKDGCYTPTVYYFDIPYSSYNFISVNAINVKNTKEKIKGDIYLLSNSQEIYVSKNNIYLTYTHYISEHEIILKAMQGVIYLLLDEKEKEKIKKIESVDNFILTREEKLEKIGLIIGRYMAKLSEDKQKELEKKIKEAAKRIYKQMSSSLEKTVIHKIAINNGELEYKTFGEVNGYLLNQFSMDEYNGFFRIATTRNRTWIHFLDLDDKEQESYNNLYILDKDLKVVGSVEKLAPGERIYSVRFMGDRAYMVTFKQMDPLFAIDLKDPYHPKVLGKLKIPGYSDYLHPYNENILIGLGKDAKTSEWGGVRATSLKLSLFDVSDVNNPREIDTFVMGDAGSNSLALHDHKAFLFSREKNLLVIPVTIREIKENSDKYYGDLSFVGAAVFYIDENGFKLKGKISHSFRENKYWNDYNTQVKRSLYIDNILYTFSNKLLKMNKIDDLELVNSLKLEKESGSDFEIIR